MATYRKQPITMNEWHEACSEYDRLKASHDNLSQREFLHKNRFGKEYAKYRRDRDEHSSSSSSSLGNEKDDNGNESCDSSGEALPKSPLNSKNIGQSHHHTITASRETPFKISEQCHMALIVMAKKSESVDILSCSAMLQKFGMKVVLAAAATGTAESEADESEDESCSDSPNNSQQIHHLVNLEPECTFQQALENTWSVLLLPGGIQGVLELVSNRSFRALMDHHMKGHSGANIPLVGACGASATDLLQHCGYYPKDAKVLGGASHPQQGQVLLKRDVLDDNGRQITPLVRKEEYYYYDDGSRTNENAAQQSHHERRTRIVWTTPGLGTTPYLVLALGEQLYGYTKAQQVATSTYLAPPISFSNAVVNKEEGTEDEDDDSCTSDDSDASELSREDDRHIASKQRLQEQQQHQLQCEARKSVLVSSSSPTNTPKNDTTPTAITPTSTSTSFEDRLFEHIAWRRLRNMGWKRKHRTLSNTRNALLRHAFSYEPPSPQDIRMAAGKGNCTGIATPKKNKKRKATATIGTGSTSSPQQPHHTSTSSSKGGAGMNDPQEVLNFLIQDAVWSRKKTSFQIVDLFLSCKRIRNMYLMDIPSCCNSPEAVEQETKRHMTALANY